MLEDLTIDHVWAIAVTPLFLVGLLYAIGLQFKISRLKPQNIYKILVEVVLFSSVHVSKNDLDHLSLQLNKAFTYEDLKKCYQKKARKIYIDEGTYRIAVKRVVLCNPSSNKKLKMPLENFYNGNIRHPNLFEICRDRILEWKVVGVKNKSF